MNDRLAQILRHDLLASIVVFLVALPLCMGIAIASGAPPAAGLLTGIIGGLVVGWIAGAPLQVSGPAAGLSVIVWELIQTHGYGSLGWIVLMAGLVQVAAGLVGFGKWFRAVSPSVIHGMLAGIGILIFASQFHVMIDDAPRGSGIANILAIPEAILKVFPADGSVHFNAAMIGLFTLSIMIFWRRLVPGAMKTIPAPLAAVVLATGASQVLGLKVIQVDIPASLLDAVSLPAFADLQKLGWWVIEPALALAFIASAETLLCATAVDKLHTGPRAKFDRELTAQGVGNALCGLLGALPMTGVIVRSSANVEAGGKTRASAILHGVWLLLFCAALPFVLRMIPTAVLAAVLVYTGYKLVNVAAVRDIGERYGRFPLIVYAATVAGIVCIDLLTGVVTGIVLSLGRILYDMTHLDVHVEQGEGTRHDLLLTGSATVVSLPRLAEALEQVPADADLHVHLDGLDYIDHACMDLLHAWNEQHRALGGSLQMDWSGLEERMGNRVDRVLASGGLSTAAGVTTSSDVTTAG